MNLGARNLRAVRKLSVMSPEVLREPVSSEPPSSDLAPNDGLLSEGLLKRPGLFALSNDPDAPVCRGDPESDELSKRVEL